MSEALITAVIPTYRRPQLLKRAVRSVLAQTYPHFQILIADNASGPESDAAVQALMKQDARVKLLKHPKHIAVTENFQAGLAQVKTPYVCFLPDDDFYAPSFFEETLSAFSRFPASALAGGRGELYIDQEYVVRSRTDAGKGAALTTGYYTPPNTLSACLLSPTGIQMPPALFKTACVREVGGFDTRLQFCFDADLLLKCVARFPVYVIADRIFYFYFQHSGSLSRSFDLFCQNTEAGYLLENILKAPLGDKQREEVTLWFKEWHIRIFSKLYGHCYNLQEFAKARLYAQKLHALTHASKWKSRQVRAALYHYLPFLHTIYTQLKVAERALRGQVKPKNTTAAESNPQYQIHADAAIWKDFALRLECD
jgi:glycosyltransferase involved in cell wall biosynthesis